jgi:RHS repeat-associated protein
MHTDRLGSTTFVTDETGATIQKTIYYPWGQAWATAGTVKDERFASMEQRDAQTGNDPTVFRMYNPRLYRWLSPDPLAGSILNPQSLNRYAYVLNNPVNVIDPLGLDFCDEHPNSPACNREPHEPRFNDAVFSGMSG